MNRFFLFFSLLIAQIGFLSAQCAETDQTKVLLVGDSWAFFMNVDQTIDNTLEKWGHSHYKYYTNTVLAENGAETVDFLTATKQDEIQAQLAAHPDIEVVHLSIGGNDILGDWDVTFSQAQTDSLGNLVFARLISVMDFIKSCKPGIKIVWSGYVYPNFEEVIESFSPFQTNHPFYGTWEGMGFPSFEQVNTVLDHFSDQVEIYAQNDPQVEFVKAPALMQYTFGQNSPLGVAPGGTYPAFTQPLPFGDLTYPSPKNSMRDYGLTKDCFHLSPKGYNDLIEYHTQKFYHKFLMDDQYFLSEGGTKDGSVSSLGNVANTLDLGANAGEELATVLSFNTTQMPDTTLTAASIFLRRKSLTGANPINGNLQIKVVNGNFGATADVEVADFTAAGDASANPCLFGSNNGNGHWIRLDLPANLLPFIHKNQPTQFLLSASNATGKVTFNDASDPDFAPVLNLTFSKPTAISSAILPAQDIHLFPNPTNGILFFQGLKEGKYEINLYNYLGQNVFQAHTNQHFIDISTLQAGVYVVEVKGENGRIVKKIVKQ